MGTGHPNPAIVEHQGLRTTTVEEASNAKQSGEIRVGYRQQAMYGADYVEDVPSKSQANAFRG
jgi:hypothetical protein